LRRLLPQGFGAESQRNGDKFDAATTASSSNAVTIAISRLTAATKKSLVSVETKPAIDAKAEQILRRAVEALGGNNYMSVHSEIGRGLFTPFRDGVSGIPSAFVDYIVFPDRERTEFRNSDGRVIQTNIGAKGWVFDGAKRSIKDMTPEQAEDFRFRCAPALIACCADYGARKAASRSLISGGVKPDSQGAMRPFDSPTRTASPSNRVRRA
jgi:hypothetical protein